MEHIMVCIRALIMSAPIGLPTGIAITLFMMNRFKRGHRYIPIPFFFKVLLLKVCGSTLVVAVLLEMIAYICLTKGVFDQKAPPGGWAHIRFPTQLVSINGLNKPTGQFLTTSGPIPRYEITWTSGYWAETIKVEWPDSVLTLEGWVEVPSDSRLANCTVEGVVRAHLSFPVRWRENRFIVNNEHLEIPCTISIQSGDFLTANLSQIVEVGAKGFWVLMGLFGFILLFFPPGKPDEPSPNG